MSDAAKLMDLLISGNLLSAQCADSENHSVVIVWSSQAEEQIEAFINYIKEHMPQGEDYRKWISEIPIEHSETLKRCHNLQSACIDALEALKLVSYSGCNIDICASAMEKIKLALQRKEWSE